MTPCGVLSALYLTSAVLVYAGVYGDIAYGRNGNRSAHSLRLYWINLATALDRRKSMETQLLNISPTGSIIAERINATDVREVMGKIAAGEIRTNGFKFVSRRFMVGKHRAGKYTFEEGACLFSHIRALERIATDVNDFGLVSEDDIDFSLPFHEKLLSALKTAPSDWEILQLCTSNQIQREHNAMLDIDWIRWLPHHYSAQLYAIKKSKAAEIVASIKSNGSYIFPYRDVVVADEYVYWRAKTYTYTGTIIVSNLTFGSSIQGRAWEEPSQQNVPRPAFPLLTSTLAIYTVFVMDNRTEFERDLKQLEMEVATMDYFYTKGVAWHVVCGMRRTEDKGFVESSIVRFSSRVTFYIHHEPKQFSKWLHIQPLVQDMDKYDDVLFKDFDQSLVGLSWKTFVSKRGTAVIAGCLREAVDESMLRQMFSKAKNNQYFQINDGRWFRRHHASDFRRVNGIERPFLEMYLVLFDGRFIKWFFSEIFEEEKHIHKISDWGPDYMWCGAAHDWSHKRVPCVLVPVISLHEDTKKISVIKMQQNDSVYHNRTSSKKFSRDAWMNEMEYPIKLWKQNPKFAKWFNYSKPFLDAVHADWLRTNSHSPRKKNSPRSRRPSSPDTQRARGGR